jgi:hypothetical protein
VLFDTVVVDVGNGKASEVVSWGAKEMKINLRMVDESRVGVTVDETVDLEDLKAILNIFATSLLPIPKSKSNNSCRSCPFPLGTSRHQYPCL